MISEDCKKEQIKPIHATAETLTCKRCGCLYASTGKKDNGYCQDCSRTINAMLKGGPLDGMRNSGLLEDD